MPNVRWAVVGCGSIAMNKVLPGIRAAENSELTITMSRSESSAKAAAERFGAQASYTNWDEFIRDDSFDAAYLGTPNYLHHPHTAALAAAGKHVLCDKPMAMNVRECEEMIEACDRAGVKLMVAQMSRFNRHNQFAEKLMRGGLLSQVSIARSHYAFHMQDRASQWRLKWEESGGGALMDIGVYCIHHLRQTIGKPIVAVQAKCYPSPETGECDITTCAILEFDGGTPAMLDASFDVNMGNGYTLAGPEGILTVSATCNQDGRGDVRWQGQAPVMAPDMQIVDPYRMQVEHFAACIQNDAQPMVRPEDSMDDVRVAMAIYESARTGRRVDLSR